MGGVGLVVCQSFLDKGRTGSLNQCSGGWSWISSLWSAVKCPGVSFEVAMGLAWLWAACLLMLRSVFLFFWGIIMVCLALEFVDSWVEFDFRVDMEALG